MMPPEGVQGRVRPGLPAMLAAMLVGSVVVTVVLMTLGPGLVGAHAGLGVGLAAVGGVATLAALVGAIRYRSTVMTESVDAGRAGSIIIVLAAISEAGLFIAAMGYAFSQTLGVFAVGALHLFAFLVLSLTVRSL